MQKFSYSKLSTMEQCPYKYKLIYKDKHFIEDKTIAQDFGTLVHFIEESIGKEIIKLNYNFEDININKFIDLCINLDDNENKVFGMKKLKQLYPEAFNEKDKNNLDYTDKGNIYLEKGIYRLLNFLKNNPNLEIIGLEKEFNLNYENYIFHGFIDRVFRDKYTNDIYIEDIKTYSNSLEKKDLTTPLQFVIYALAAKDLYNIDEDRIHCSYEIPLCDIKQEAGTKGFIKRGCNKITQILKNIENNVIDPKPSPLCHWCVFSKTFPNQPEEAKNLCPYYCKWTRENKDFSCENDWLGIEAHDKLLEAFINKQKLSKHVLYEIKGIDIASTIDIGSERRFLFRR